MFFWDTVLNLCYISMDGVGFMGDQPRTFSIYHQFFTPSLTEGEVSLLSGREKGISCKTLLSASYENALKTFVWCVSVYE